MSIDLDKILKWLTSLNEMASVPLTFVCCLAIGLAVKWMPFIKNQYIPTIVVFSGPLLLVLLTDFKASPAMTVRSFVTRTIIIGFVTSSASWLTHRFALKPLLIKMFGKENGFDSSPSALTDAQVKKQDEKNP